MIYDSEENCAFAFAVTENQGQTCNVIRLRVYAGSKC